MIRKPASRMARAGHVVGNALHQAGDAVEEFSEDAGARAYRASRALLERTERALPSVGGVKGDVYETSRRLGRSVTRRPDDAMLWALGMGFFLGYITGWLSHRR